MIAGIYVRTSTVRQGEEGTSLETQEEQAVLKATELGYQVDPAYIWRDMESGAYIDRAGVNLMLEAVKNREVDIVIVYDHDRLSRDPLDLLNVQRVCIEARVPLEFVRGPSHTTPEGQLMTYFLGYAAQRERAQFMERTMRSKERAAKDGRMPTTAWWWRRPSMARASGRSSGWTWVRVKKAPSGWPSYARCPPGASAGWSWWYRTLIRDSEAPSPQSSAEPAGNGAAPTS